MKTVKTVAEYLGFLDTIDRITIPSCTVSSNTFFRGQSNAKWKLTPSLYRQGLFFAENLLLTEMKHVCPREFTEDRFDSLVKMQHFGMPTRLLDTTTNPLVALYFACENENEKDEQGAVYVFPNLPVSWSTDPLVDLIMDFVYEYNAKGADLDFMLERIKVKYADVINRRMPDSTTSLLHYLTIPAFAVMPAKTNERIEAQDGAFFIFGMKSTGTDVRHEQGAIKHVLCKFGPIETDQSDQIWYKTETILIPASAKDNILRQLDLLGVNERKLFPDLTHQIHHTVQTVKAQMI